MHDFVPNMSALDIRPHVHCMHAYVLSVPCHWNPQKARRRSMQIITSYDLDIYFTHFVLFVCSIKNVLVPLNSVRLPLKIADLRRIPMPVYIYMLQAIREVRHFMKYLKMSGISWSGEKLCFNTRNAYIL